MGVLGMGQDAVHALVVIGPVHYWQRYTGLFQGGDGGLALGVAVQAATVAVVMAAAYAIFARRDPAA
jgi:ABC-2 type transport system permease protein